MELTETEDEFAISAEVPGFTEKDVEVRVELRRIYISGKREEKREQEKGETLHTEQRANQIFRSFELPADIDPDNVTATLKDGLLKVVLPKARKAKKVLVSASAA
jgi:HSP20 family protein